MPTPSLMPSAPSLGSKMPIGSDALVSFLENRVEPLEDSNYGKRNRASARLTDGTYLPCVIFQGRESHVQLALRRFKQLEREPKQYEQLVASFVSKRSSVSEWQIDSVELSRFAWPQALLRTIHGETSMSWTSFVTEMSDGSLHSFGTSFSTEFFDLPAGYDHQDIKQLLSGMVYAAGRGLTEFSMDASKEAKVYRERPYFTCYLDNLH
jgi:hypothetical protein